MTTSLYTGKVPSRVKGQTTCIHHKGRQLGLYCTKCEELVCEQCVAGLHISHPMCDLSEVIPHKILEIMYYIYKIEEDDLVKVAQSVTSTNSQLNDNIKTSQQISNEMEEETNNSRDLDLLTENRKVLQKYVQELEVYSNELKQRIQESKVVLQRGSNIEIYDVWYEITNTSVTMPEKPTFTSNRNPVSLQNLASGDISTSEQDASECKTSKSRNHSVEEHVSIDEGLRATNKLSKQLEETTRFEEKHTLLSRTKEIRHYTTSDRIYQFCPSGDGHLWMNSGTGYKLILLDKTGTAIQTIKHSTWINGISLSPRTNTLWVCDDKNNFLELVSGRLTEKFSTSENPRCLYITTDNHVLVGMAKHISKFTTNGETVLTTMSEGAAKPIVYSPHRISECPVTNNIALVDRSYKYDGGDGEEHVLVIDACFQKLFVYDGECPSDVKTPHRKPLHICGTAYNSVGNIIIGDCTSRSILLISGRGDFLKIIYSSIYSDFDVSVDKKDVLWVVLEGYIVKQLKYMQ